MTKVTYNTYSCAISGMSREMMEMDGRDSAECQNWEKKGHRCHFGIVNEENDKRANSAHLLPQIEDKNVKGRRGSNEV